MSKSFNLGRIRSRGKAAIAAALLLAVQSEYCNASHVNSPNHGLWSYLQSIKATQLLSEQNIIQEIPESHHKISSKHLLHIEDTDVQHVGSNSIKQNFKGGKTSSTNKGKRHSNKRNKGGSSRNRNGKGQLMKYKPLLMNATSCDQNETEVQKAILDWKTTFDQLSESLPLQITPGTDFKVLKNGNSSLLAETIFQRDWDLLCRKDFEGFESLADSDLCGGKYTPSLPCSILSHKLVNAILQLINLAEVDCRIMPHYLDQLNTKLEQMEVPRADMEAAHRLILENSNVSADDVSRCFGLLVQTIQDCHYVNEALYDVIETFLRAAGRIRCMLLLTQKCEAVFSAAMVAFDDAHRESLCFRGFNNAMKLCTCLYDRHFQCLDIVFGIKGLGNRAAEIFSDFIQHTEHISGVLMEFRELSALISSVDHVRYSVHSLGISVDFDDQAYWLKRSVGMIGKFVTAFYSFSNSCSSLALKCSLNEIGKDVEYMSEGAYVHLSDFVFTFSGQSSLFQSSEDLLMELLKNKAFIDEVSMFMGLYLELSKLRD
jgi:hypothetical protein